MKKLITQDEMSFCIIQFSQLVPKKIMGNTEENMNIDIVA